MATSELLWLQSLLTEVGQLSTTTPVLWCDNFGATFLAANPVFHACTKHIELDFNFVREKLADNKLDVRFLCFADQIADVFMKSLGKTRFHTLTVKLTVLEKPLCLRGTVNDGELDNSNVEATGHKLQGVTAS
jgi:hypothetical protein